MPHFVTEVHEKREIKFGDDEFSKREPVTTTTLFRDCVKKNGPRPAYQWKEDDVWKSCTWQQYWDSAMAVAKSMIAFGMEEKEVISIIGFNSPGWVLSYIGGICAGGIGSGIYATNGPEACKYQVEHSDSTIVCAENAEHMSKFVKICDELPKVRAYVQWTGELPEGATTEKNFYTWEEFLAKGRDIDQKIIDERLERVSADECATLIYTSGTTAMPKGTMISHDNLTWTALAAATLYDFGPGERIVSYLPMSHIAALMIDVIAPLNSGGCIYFAQPDALKGSLGATLKEVEPTVFLGVPRVWEKIEEKMRSIGAANSSTKQFIASQAKAIGLAGSYAEQKGEPYPWGWFLANKVVLGPVREALGLQHCKIQATAAAPISRETLDYFMSLHIPICEIYGMSECCGPQTISVPVVGKYKTGTVGKSIPGTELKIDNPDKDGNGEIWYKGRHIFMGYLKNPEATAETLDEEGWLHSGDVGKLDEEGFLMITGRIKELIITAGGENIPPVLIEDEIKKHVGKLVSNVMVIGDKRKFLTAVFTLRCEPNPDFEPGTYPFTEKLDKSAIDVCQEIGSNATTVSEAIDDEKIKKFIENGVKKANEVAISNAQKVQKFEILAQDFSVEGNELTPTLKLKRRIVDQKYEEIINKMYDV